MGKLDTSRFMVIGEGLAAGMTNFSLIEDDQRDSFSAHVAKRIGERFPLPLFQAPGIGDAPGFQRLPVRVPWDMQTTVIKKVPPTGAYANLSLPGLTAADVVNRRPEIPIVRTDDALQTAINLVLGLEECREGQSSPGPTVLEFAARQKPGLALIELGLAEVLAAAVASDPAALPGAAFMADYATILSTLASAGATLIVLTIPDPMDTAHFSTLDAAARVVRLPASRIQSRYGLQSHDRVTPNALMEMGYQTMTKRFGPLPDGSVMKGECATEISRKVEALNKDLVSLAQKHDALVFDLHAFFRQVREQGVRVGTRRITADYLGGFYSLNGYYPGKSGQAMIANGLIDLWNRTAGTRHQKVDIGPMLIMNDAVLAYQGAEGPMHGTPAGVLAASGATAKRLIKMAKFVSGMVRGKRQRQEMPTPPTSGCHPERWKIKLPPGLEQTLPLDSESSYYGDALRAVHTTEAQPKVYGLTGNLLFSGIALLDTHLHGSIQIKFAPPQDDSTHFEISLLSGLKGDDGRLSAPHLFCLPALDNRVMDAAEVLSSGDLNLITGWVTNLKCKFFLLNSAIFALAAVNPTLPAAPIDFPGFYGTTWAGFESRPDGLLDFTLHATTFIPLSVLHVPVRFPMPFASASGKFASVPSDGTALHPHIHLSTKPPAPADPGVRVPLLPTNTVWQMMGSMHNNTFGDDFALNAPELGGHGMGRSHLNCRYSIQFGERFGDAVSVYVATLPPGGLLAEVPESPLTANFGSRIPRGAPGHDEALRFGTVNYRMGKVSMIDDPLDFALCIVNLKTGKIVGEMLHRGLISQRIIMKLLEVEPRTPTETFTWRGPGSFEVGNDGQTIFRYNGVQYLPYPEGFKFPTDDLESHIVIGPDSVLYPFLRHQAMPVVGHEWRPRSGEAHITSSNGQEFSYKYEIPEGRAKPFFEFTNHALGGTFKLNCLTWLHYLRSRTSKAAPGECDTVTFSGLGSWSLDPTNGVHIAVVQICTSPEFPYVSVIIDPGWYSISNVNTKPKDMAISLP
ncbi:MAG: hypothetical protein NTV05_06115 [Acidobacteria bacterium]|nr:hypothetical protein [Acidobacteriota bacterium]